MKDWRFAIYVIYEVEESVEHIFNECAAYQQERYDLWNEMNGIQNAAFIGERVSVFQMVYNTSNLERNVRMLTK